MMLKRSTRESKPRPRATARLVRASLAGLAAVVAVTGLATGCLDRKVVPAKPTTSNVFVDQIVQTAVDKIDLLFMIDNSVSMADKQDILAAAVPVLLGRLVSPICVDGNGMPDPKGTSGTCTAPYSAEFSPIGDIHIGIVSSSLGAHGGTVCAAPSAGDDLTITHLNDNAHLVGSLRTGADLHPPTAATSIPSWNNSGFLAWDPSGTKDVPPGEKVAANLKSDFTTMVIATGEHGCGYEASLESWYRFLIDPEPPAAVIRVGNTTVRGVLQPDMKTVVPTKQNINADGSLGTCDSCDMTLLAQRAAFLRPDSLVAVVMLSDENDCSIRDDTVGWFVGAGSHMPKAAAPCAQNPNDKCCRSCAQVEDSPPPGCMALSADPVCMNAPANSYNTWDMQNDALNLRCYNQKLRFGFDLLYETDRYVSGLTSPTLRLQSDGTTSVTNPLYATGTSGKPPRDPSLVFLAGIVGVPWQDIATADSLTSQTALTYLTATQLAAQGRWAQLLGTATASPPVAPSDPFMVETTQPRTGTNPNVAVNIAAANLMNPQASVINGHEQNIPQLDDLQYACTFKLSAPKVCAAGDPACDCSPTKDPDPVAALAAVTTANSPLCQPPGGGAPGATQYYAKAYPGARELTVLRDFKDNAIVASICPKVTTAQDPNNPGADPNYGYNPAVGAIIERLKDALKGKCLPRALAKVPDAMGNPTNQVECEVIEAQKAGNCKCPDNNPVNGRVAADPKIASAVFSQLENSGTCGKAPAPPCNASGFCMCEILQEQGDNLTQCQANAPTVPTPGYCYIDQAIAAASGSLSMLALKSCPDNQQRVLRFADDGSGTNKLPAAGAIAFIACLGAPITPDGG